MHVIDQGLQSGQLITAGFSVPLFGAEAAMEGPGLGILVQGLGGPLLLTGGYIPDYQPYSEAVVDWTVFSQHVLPWVKGCPDAVVRRHCIDASRIFFAKTRLWQVKARLGTAIDGKTEYRVAPANADRVKLENVTLGDDSTDRVDVQTGAADALGGSQHPEAYLDDPNTLVLNAANAGDAIQVGLALKPSLDAEGFPARYISYLDDIAHGAVATLAMLPRQEWSDMRQAQLKTGLFGERIAATAFNRTIGYRRLGQRQAGSRLL